jgi:hypothetical protein
MPVWDWPIDSPGPDYCDRCLKDLPKVDLERVEMPRFEDAPRRGPVAPPPAEPVPLTLEPPLLIAPHTCHACNDEILTAFGLRRHDVAHKPGCRASVYALLFRCPCCGRHVELPLRLAGQAVECPACKTGFAAPRDGVLHERTADVEEREVMRFRCSACKQGLQCHTQVGGEAAVGMRVVCPACRCVIEVPPAGHRV